MKLALLLALLLTVCECDSVRVEGHTGQNVTLPCKYDRKYYGALPACWQQGEIPTSGCSNQLISTDGDKVLTSATSRYQLLGRLEDGDVSLTIKNLTEGDAGRYGCRVEIPGLFNDDKHHFDLTVVPGIHTSTASTTDTPTEPTAASQTQGHVTSTESPLTSSSRVTQNRKAPHTMVSLISVLLVLAFLLTLGGLVVAVRRLKRLVSAPQQKVGQAHQVQFSSTASTLQLQSSTLDNIYQMESDCDGGGDDGGGGDRGGGEDGGDYEYCP